MSTSPTGFASSASLRLPTLPPMQCYSTRYRPSVQLAPLLWNDGRRGSIGTRTDGGDSSGSEGRMPIERLRLTSRSVSPLKSLPPIALRKLHFPPSSARRRSHPTLESAPRRLILGDPSFPSTAVPRRDSLSPRLPGIALLPRTAGYRSMRPITPMSVHAARYMVPPTPRTLKEAQGVGRMVLVNPIIAAHLKRGGVVNVKSRDGTRRWRISLPATATSPVVESAVRGSQKV